MISYFPSAFGTDFWPKTHPDHTFGSKRPPKVAKREPKGTPGGSWKLSWGSFWQPWDLLGALWALTRALGRNIFTFWASPGSMFHEFNP